VFGRLLGPRSFDSLKRPFVHKQTSLPITFGGVGLISRSTIALTTYLGYWAIVALVIATRFMVDQHPFFLEALNESITTHLLSNNTSRWHVIFYHH
jgi:hypothetical protein